MNAPPAAQRALLDLQALDATLDRLAHRRRTLPELAALAALAEEISAVQDDIVRAETEVSDLTSEQDRIDGDVEVVRSRMTRDQRRLDTGQVGSPRELESLQSEIVSLRRRQRDLEDAELEVMQRREEAEGRLAALSELLASLAAEQSELTSRRDAKFADIDAEAADATQRREPVRAQIPADLLALYDRIRSASGGVGAAALQHGRCEGCRLSLPPVDLNAYKAAPPDAVLRCEECGRILVRVPESGL